MHVGRHPGPTLNVLTSESEPVDVVEIASHSNESCVCRHRHCAFARTYLLSVVRYEEPSILEDIFSRFFAFQELYSNRELLLDRIGLHRLGIIPQHLSHVKSKYIHSNCKDHPRKHHQTTFK